MPNTLPPAAPESLQEAGAALWGEVLGSFELAAHETVILLQACQTLDLLGTLQTLVDREGPVLAYGEGNSRAHPAVVEIRQHRITLARLIASLGIPVEGESRASGQGQGAARGVYRLPTPA